MATAIQDQIPVNEQGVAYITGLALRVVDVVRIKQERSMTPEQIQGTVPRLSLTQIHAALAYYDSHRTEMDLAEVRHREAIETLLSQLRPRHQPLAGRNWLSLVVDKWPGNETDEEIDAALERIS